MFQSFFTGLSGLFSFSKNLDTVSNNIANMNTTGYRGVETFYNSLNGENGLGYGTQLSDVGYRFGSGDIKQSDSATDLAISGNGMFVLIEGDDTYYTRAGQFTLDQDGILIDKTSGKSVAAIDESGQLVEFNIDPFQIYNPEPTTSVSFTGNLSSGAVSHDVSSVSVINALGEEEFITFQFSNNSATISGSWLVDILDSNDNIISSSEIRFGSDGTPLNDFNSIDFNITDSMGGESVVTLNFGDNGDFSQTTGVDSGTTSTLQATVDDGNLIGNLNALGFGADGAITFSYSNGETRVGPKLAIALFTNEKALKLVNGAIFTADDNSSRIISSAGEGKMGQILSQSLEMSNVDLSQEFADMLIIQRGYQASSRVLNAADQLLEKLYENTRG